MSSVRMCDNCREIFSENDPGWQRGTIQQLQGDGSVLRVASDLCPTCAVGGLAPQRFEPHRVVTQLGQDPRAVSGGLPSRPGVEVLEGENLKR